MEDLEYRWSEDEEDALLNRAYDRWEQLGGAAARGPLFHFTMQPMGRRRRWREVVERAQFHAQLRQLRDPVPGDNIGMALTEALHQAIETELDREQRPAHHFVNFAITAHGLPTPTKQLISPWVSFYNVLHVWMKCWLPWLVN